MPPKKADAGSNDKKATELIISLLIGLFLVAALISGLLNYVENLGAGAPETFWARIGDYFLLNIWPVWKIVAALVSITALFGIVRNLWKLGAINSEEEKIYNPKPEEHAVGMEGYPPAGGEPKNEKWENILKLFNSDNPSNWRQAIIGADVMLEELVRSLGYTGESLGEMLKSVDKSDFLTLEDAWEAHKVRNAIAHSGADFQLTEREARRVMSLYENVFREFQVI